MIKKLRKLGRERGVVIDASLLAELGLGDGDSIELIPRPDGVLLRKAIGKGSAPGTSPPQRRAGSKGTALPFEDELSIRSDDTRSTETERRSHDRSRTSPQEVESAAGPAPVRADRIRAWVDGGSRGNPGPAGYGAYIDDGAGGLLAKRSGFLGIATNNVAEYQGLLAALRAAREMGARYVEILADSLLIVQQMNGRWQVKNEALKRLHAEARALADRIERFSIKHVPREKNREADKLANEAMDRGV